MPINDNRLLELALEALEEKRRGIDDEISQIKSRLGSGGAAKAAAASRGDSPASSNGRKTGKRKMTPAQKKLVSDRMKKYWADRKKGKK